MTTDQKLLQQAEQAIRHQDLTMRQRCDLVNAIRARLAQLEQKPVLDGNTSDGYHTFNELYEFRKAYNELYEFRKAYNVALFNEWAANGKCSVHKSWRHHDGELCFGGGWFIVVAVLPQGQISNHYEAKDWDLFRIQEVANALFEFDGHTGLDVIARLKSYTALTQPEQEPITCQIYGHVVGHCGECNVGIEREADDAINETNHILATRYLSLKEQKPLTREQIDAGARMVVDCNKPSFTLGVMYDEEMHNIKETK